MGRRAWLALAIIMALSGCSPPEPPVSGHVRVLTSWSGAEADAFRAVVAPFESATGVTVGVESTRELRGIIAAGLAAGTPPDLAGLEGPAHMRDLAASGALRDLRDVVDIGSYRAAVAPTFIDMGSVDGRLVGVFVRSSAKGLIWYSPRVFTLGRPRDWEELQRMALQAQSRAEAEWCVGLGSEEASGWPGTDLVEQFLLRIGGTATYDAWVAGDLAWTSPLVRRAFELYGQVVADGAVFGGRTGAIETDFRDAGKPLFSLPAGCLFLPQGSFMPSFLTAPHREPIVDYDFFPFPALDGDGDRVVIGGGDLFGLLTDDPAARRLMRYLVSEDAQERWVRQGGSLSVRATVHDYPDPISRRMAELLTGAEAFRFDASDQMAADMNAAFWQAILDVTADPSQLDATLERLEALRVAPAA
jgi:alpha-glucoside transport system substrate-binding protein